MFKKIGDGGSWVSLHDSDVTERWYPIKCSISDKYAKRSQLECEFELVVQQVQGCKLKIHSEHSHSENRWIGVENTSN